MNFVSSQLEISLLKDVNSQNPCLYFKFKGKFTEQASIAGCMNWSAEMDAQPHTDFDMVWDCSDMAGFEFNARKEWYDCMVHYKDRISTVHVLGGSLMLRSAAKVMLSYFKINYQIHKDVSDLPVGFR